MLPWLVAMLGLICCSAFCSASEAALFSLRPIDRRSLAHGNRAQRTANELLNDPERVLSAVLFWNLVVNLAYFIVATKTEEQLPKGPQTLWAWRAVSLLMMIFLSEMLPKTLAVLIARQLSTAVSIPLAFMIRVVDPFMPILRFITLASRRLIWPHFTPETALDAADLERAVELSSGDAKLLAEERMVLRNLVGFSDLRADETMRPRTQLQLFRAPVSLRDLEGAKMKSGYLFVLEADSDNIAEAVRLSSLWALHPDHLEAATEPVVYVPWCSSIANTLHQLRERDREVAVVVNEWGETMGVITMEDIYDVAFTQRASRSQRLLKREPIRLIQPGLWQATDMTNLKAMAEFFDVDLPMTHNKTVGGVIQEQLQSIPQPGNRCTWGDFEFEVSNEFFGDHRLIHIRRNLTDGIEST